MIRPLDHTDSVDELTELLHAAYAPLAAAGLHFVAAGQSADVTRRRLARAFAFVVEDGGRLVGTIALYAPPAPGEDRRGEWYARPDVAKFGQLGVHPDWKGHGLGRDLMDHVERFARDAGWAELACDTSESATALIAMYRRRGYREVGRIDWRPDTNYESVILSKRLR